jgi:hypothetical protein
MTWLFAKEMKPVPVDDGGASQNTRSQRKLPGSSDKGETVGGGLQIIVIRQETLAPKAKTKALLWANAQLRAQNLLKIICTSPKPRKLG